MDLSNIPLINLQETTKNQKQALLTAHSLLVEGIKDTQKVDDHGGSKGSVSISLGEGLTPIPYRLVEKIFREEFVDMQELLTKFWWKAGQKGENPPQKCSKCRVLDIKVRVQYFACYMRMVATRSPQRIPELLAYLILIVRVNQEFAGSGWVVYVWWNVLQAGSSLWQPAWSKVNTSLFSLCFIGKGHKTARCSWCLGIPHMTEKCQVLWEEDRLSQEEQDMMGRSRKGSQHNAALVRHWPICRNFNHGQCSDRTFRYYHICLDCNGNHPRIACGSLSSLGHLTPGNSSPRQCRY